MKRNKPYINQWCDFESRCSKRNELMDVAEVSSLLRLSRKAIYQMVARGELPGIIRIGKRLRFDREVLLRFIEKNRV